jgi:hypothetical protein
VPAVKSRGFLRPRQDQGLEMQWVEAKTTTRAVVDLTSGHRSLEGSFAMTGSGVRHEEPSCIAGMGRVVMIRRQAVSRSPHSYGNSCSHSQMRIPGEQACGARAIAVIELIILTLSVFRLILTIDERRGPWATR